VIQPDHRGIFATTISLYASLSFSLTHNLYIYNNYGGQKVYGLPTNPWMCCGSKVTPVPIYIFSLRSSLSRAGRWILIIADQRKTDWVGYNNIYTFGFVLNNYYNNRYIYIYMYIIFLIICLFNVNRLWTHYWYVLYTILRGNPYTYSLHRNHRPSSDFNI